jgi:hypothetical protein
MKQAQRKLLRIKTHALFFFAAALLSNIACADGEDVPLLTEMIGQNAEMMGFQSSLMANTITVLATAQDQFSQTTKEWGDLTKTFGMADSDEDKAARLWSADDWKSVLEQASGGNNDRFQTLMKSYSDKYPTVKTGQTINAAKLADTTYKEQSQTTNAALSSANYTFDDLNNRIKKTEELLAQVDDPSKNQNQKASTDLNSRLVAEQNFTQLDATKNQGEVNSDTMDKILTHYKSSS